MAENANEGRVRADIRPPDYRAALLKIRTQIAAKKKKLGEVQGEISDVWAKIEGHKVNKQAAKFFAKCDGMEAKDRADIIRSFNGLADAAGWDKDASDLADGGKVVPMRLGEDAEGEEGEGDDAGEGAGEEEGEGDEPDRARRARRSGPAAAVESLQRVRRRMGDGRVGAPAA